MTINAQFIINASYQQNMLLFFKSLPSILNNENSDCTIGPIWLVLYHSTFIGFGREWSGGAMVLGKLPGPIVLAVGAGGGCLDIFTLLYLFSSLSPSLWETGRYRLKYCLKGPLNPKQPTNQFIGFGEASSYWSVQFFFSFVTILVVNLPERTKTGLITRLDKTVRAEHSCNSLLGHFVLLRLASYN